MIILYCLLIKMASTDFVLAEAEEKYCIIWIADTFILHRQNS